MVLSLEVIIHFYYSLFKNGACILQRQGSVTRLYQTFFIFFLQWETQEALSNERLRGILISLLSHEGTYSDKGELNFIVILQTWSSLKVESGQSETRNTTIFLEWECLYIPKGMRLLILP